MMGEAVTWGELLVALLGGITALVVSLAVFFLYRAATWHRR